MTDNNSDRQGIRNSPVSSSQVCRGLPFVMFHRLKQDFMGLSFFIVRNHLCFIPHHHSNTLLGWTIPPVSFEWEKL